MLRLTTLIPLLLISCDFSAGKEAIATCADVCVSVEECGATPPSVQLEGLAGSSGSGGVDCAANCAQEDMRAFYGYSDCQLTCLSEVACEQMNDCWDAQSESYATYCLADRTTTPVAPTDTQPAPTNGSTTGSTAADDVVDDPAVEAAVEGAAGDDFAVNFGETPPVIKGHFRAVGTIDSSSNARPEGSRIDTTLCFSNLVESAEGTVTDYCEDGVPGTATAPVTGSGNDFTMYLEYAADVTILFSGTVDPATGNPTNVEALVVYTYAVDVWELSHTNWTWEGDCSGCQ